MVKLLYLFRHHAYMHYMHTRSDSVLQIKIDLVVLNITTYWLC